MKSIHVHYILISNLFKLVIWKQEEHKAKSVNKFYTVQYRLPKWILKLCKIHKRYEVDCKILLNQRGQIKVIKL